MLRGRKERDAVIDTNISLFTGIHEVHSDNYGDDQHGGDEEQDESLLHVAPRHGRNEPSRRVRYTREIPYFTMG